MKIFKFTKFNESISEKEEYLNLILDKILMKKSLSDTEKKFLLSYSKDKSDEFYEKFKNRIEKSRILDNMDKYDVKDIVRFSKYNPELRITKEIEKIDDDEFYIHSTVDGWLTASLSKEELIDYMIGKKDDSDFKWE